MTQLKTVKPELATGSVAQTYAHFNEVFGKVPNIFQFHSASPGIYKIMTGYFQFLREHQTFSMPLLAFMRLIVSYRNGGDYCVNFNAFILHQGGMSKEQLQNIAKEQIEPPLDERELALLKLGVDIAYAPEKIDGKRLELLRNYGWSDAELYEIGYAAVLQKGMVNLVKTFGIEQDYPILFE